MHNPINKRKIINDPVHGFITIPDELTFDLIGHPYFQRLRRIKQLGLTGLVYPGAVHTRFHHALGAMHLMMLAIDTLKIKGVEIEDHEALAAYNAILLHDIGHGPFSHALEHCIVHNIHHEELTRLFMTNMNQQFGERLSESIDIFNNQHSKKFLHQLVSGQLDVDRLDYLSRDSFFTGVSEGIIGTERIIKMLNVADGNLVAEVKGIYSIEKFIISRRLMYWQVYLHKTVIAAEQILVKILKRAEFLVKNGFEIQVSHNLELFFKNSFTVDDFKNNSVLLETFAQIDDVDIMFNIKNWQHHSDYILSTLSRYLINRQLFKVLLQENPFEPELLENLIKDTCKIHPIAKQDAHYFVFTDKISNKTYSSGGEAIQILLQNNETKDVRTVSDQLKNFNFTKSTTKYYLCHPKGI